MTMAGAEESRCQGLRLGLGHGAVITEHWAAMGLYKHQVLPSSVVTSYVTDIERQGSH